MHKRLVLGLSIMALTTWVAACGDNLKSGPDAGSCTPVDDSNECTTDTCENNLPVHTPVAAGTPCATGACDGAGNCEGPAVCGDGVVQTGEICDDGNMTNGDGCDDGTGGTCRPTGCGNGTVSGTEVCDDGNATDGDGCDNNCTVSACGNEITAGTEACDDGNTIPGDGCDALCAVEPGYTCDLMVPSVCTTTCGDGIRAGGEECDDAPPAEDGDGCSATCTVEPGFTCVGDMPSVCTPTQICGNGAVEGTETCDDGNTVAVDGCGATCQLELTEIEPNEDGTPQTGGSGIAGNDFDGAGGIAVMNADSNGAIDVANGPTAVLAALTPAGDEDVFAITNTSTVPQRVRFDIWNTDVGFGAGVACGTSIDTGLNLRDAAGTVLASNDDRNGAADRCSALSFVILPGQTVYAHVTEFGDNGAIAGYGLQIVPTAIVCGDGVVDPAFEECDDGNADDTDACSNTCLLNGAIDEIEPNGLVAEADATGIDLTATSLIRASIGTAGDADVFKLTVAAETVLRFETFAPGPGGCDATTTTLRLLDAAGTTITTDNGSGINGCAALVIRAVPGTYYIQAEETGNNATVAKYFLEVSFAAAPGAEAEAANTSGGNDTSATAEPNLATATEAWVFGDHTFIGDVDMYAVTVPDGMGLRAEIVEGDRTIETCEGNNVDSRLTLFGPDGTTQLVDDDDDGRGFCSMIDGTSATPRDAAAKNTTGAPVTWFLAVRQSTFASGTDAQFIYELQLTIR